MQTSTPDTQTTSEHLYDLTDLLRHAVAAIEKCEKAITNAERIGDEELTSLFTDLRANWSDQVTRIRERLMRELDNPVPKLDVVDEASIESFPASDAPAY